MVSRRIGRLSFFVGLILLFAAALTWLITRDWQNLLPTWWQVLLLIVSLLLVSTQKLITTFSHWRAAAALDPIPPVLQNMTVEALLRPLGRGGRVNYLFRQVVDSDDLISHRRLVITGETGSGKTRTAVELVRRLILEDIISPQGVFVPVPAFQFLNRAELKAALEKIQSSHPVQLLFLDNLPGQVPDVALDLLSDLLTACEPALVIATARTEDLWEPFRQWLEKEIFNEIRLQEPTKEQVKRLVDLAGGTFGLQINETARSVLADHLDPSPGRLLVAFQRLANRGVAYVTPDQVLPHTLGNVTDSSFAERTRLMEATPDCLFILEALAHFRSAHLQPDIPLVIQFANTLWKQAKLHSRFPQLSNHLPALYRSIPELAALDISQHDGLFEASQLVLDNISNPEIARQKLETFFLERGQSTPDRLQKNLDPYATRQAWNLFLLGSAAQLKNDPARAIRLFSKAISIHPHAWFFTHRSVAYSTRNRIDEAVNDANQAIRLDSRSAPAYTIRANFLLLKNEFNLAIEDYTKAIELDPKDAQAWLNRGNAYFAKEDLDKAINDFDTALQLAPSLTTAVMARAKAHNVHGRLDQAIADYDQALALNPEDVQLLYSRAAAYDSIGDYPRAIAEYDKLITLNPKDSQAFYNRGKAYHMLGNLEQAVLDYEQAILANPRSAIAYRNRANALIRLNRLMEAKSDCREAERLEPNHPYTHARWGQYFAAREDHIGAIEKYNLAARLIGNPTHFNLDIGLCLLSSGNSTEGLAKIKERLRKGSKQDEIQEALRDYEAQLTKRPTAGLREAITMLRQASTRV